MRHEMTRLDTIRYRYQASLGVLGALYYGLVSDDGG